MVQELNHNKHEVRDELGAQQKTTETKIDILDAKIGKLEAENFTLRNELISVQE